jgi:hypothetical protein
MKIKIYGGSLERSKELHDAVLDQPIFHQVTLGIDIIRRQIRPRAMVFDPSTFFSAAQINFWDGQYAHSEMGD